MDPESSVELAQSQVESQVERFTCFEPSALRTRGRVIFTRRPRGRAHAPHRGLAPDRALLACPSPGDVPSPPPTPRSAGTCTRGPRASCGQYPAPRPPTVPLCAICAVRRDVGDVLFTRPYRAVLVPGARPDDADLCD